MADPISSISDLNPLILVCGSLAIATVNSHQSIATQIRTLVTEALDDKGGKEARENSCRQIQIFHRRWWLVAVFHMCLYTLLALVLFAGLKYALPPWAVPICSCVVGLIAILRVYELYLGSRTLKLAIARVYPFAPWLEL